MEIIKGKVVRGQALGSKLGFPTLNIPYDGEVSGIFAAEVLIGEKIYKAAVSVGLRPTVDSTGEKFCEAFLLDFNKIVQEETEIEVHLLKKIREVEKFDSLDELKEQIAKDVEKVKHELKR